MIDIKNSTFSFLDIETTGGDYNKDRIIEVFVSKMQNGKLIDTFHSFFNPGFTPNQFILNLTNISPKDLQIAPTFEEVAEELLSFIEDDILVAHNARFDYSFLRSEFAQLGYEFKNSYCCSVKLSRLLYPQYKKHNLDSIIQRFEISDGDRHRAQYDTEAIKVLFYKSLEKFGSEKFIDAVNKSIKKASIPEGILKFDFKKIPETPGVYIFYGENKFPLYVGMSKNLRKRVLSHLYGDITYLKDSKINSQIKDIEITETGGVLGALLKESALVKSLMPVYNRKLRRNRSLVQLTKFLDLNGYLNISIKRNLEINTENLSNIIGVFDSPRTVKAILQGYVKKYGLCPKLLDLEKPGHACFSSQLGYCKGACKKLISANEYNNIFEDVFDKNKSLQWPYKSSIKIKEETESIRNEFTVDKWCIIDSSDKTLLSYDSEKYSFNLDTYKILKSYINENKHDIVEIEEESLVF